jgi:hypothetical protein
VWWACGWNQGAVDYESLVLSHSLRVGSRGLARLTYSSAWNCRGVRETVRGERICDDRFGYSDDNIAWHCQYKACGDGGLDVPQYSQCKKTKSLGKDGHGVGG